MNFWTLIAIMALLGVLTHWAKQVTLARRANVPGMGVISLKDYWVTYWPETITAISSTVAGIALLHELGHVTPVAAYGVGYLGNSAADLIGGRVQAMLSAATNSSIPKDPP
jgi:hypothetical protein